MAFSVRERLQAQHHSTRSYIPALQLENVVMPIRAMTVIIFLEVLFGMGIALMGYVQMVEINSSRLCDLTRYNRYDEYMSTGVGFIHFNHRGTLAGCCADGTRLARKTEGDKKNE